MQDKSGHSVDHNNTEHKPDTGNHVDHNNTEHKPDTGNHVAGYFYTDQYETLLL